MDYEMRDGQYCYCDACGASKIPLRKGYDFHNQWVCELCDRTDKGQNVNVNASLNVAIEIIVRRLKEEK